MKETEFSRKITWFSFVFSILVVWTHSFNAELFLGDTVYGDRLNGIESLFGDLAAQIAVPGFFMISGYLFYRNFTWHKLKSKWESRIRSVLVPYIVWNTLYYLAYAAGSRIPGVTELMGKGEIPFNLTVLADAMVNHTYLYVFWYLYQLILLILLAPVLYGLLKRSWTAAIYFAGLLGLLWIGWDKTPLNGDALLYYSAAAYLALRNEKPVERGFSARRRLAGVGLMAVAAVCLWLAGRVGNTFFVVLFRLLMVSGLWLFVREDRLKELRPWMCCNFFLYATHFALVRFINKSAAAVFHIFYPLHTEPPLWPEGMIPLTLYLVMPAVAAAASYWFGKGINRLCPPLFRLLNGGRAG